MGSGTLWICWVTNVIELAPLGLEGNADPTEQLALNPSNAQKRCGLAPCRLSARDVYQGLCAQFLAVRTFNNNTRLGCSK